MELLTPQKHSGYLLIDSGNFEKLERFGDQILRRPEPQAIWSRSMSEEEWEKSADAFFKKDKGSQEKGEWITKKTTPEKWAMNYVPLDLKIKLSLSSFKHVGVFPEQAVNWDYITEKVRKIENAQVLNLFAYTGVASVAARAAGAKVTHVDAIKQVITWSRENLEMNQLDGVSWMVEDAMKFVKREVRRGKSYNGIILDPPAYGRGPNGEKWVLEEQLNEMISECSKLLKNKDFFFIINCYSLGFSALILDNLLKEHFSHMPNYQSGELFLQDSFDKRLPLGVFGRFSDV